MHIFKELSILVNTGVAPQSIIASIVAIKLNGWVITSSPGLIPRAFKQIFKAEVPEDTANEYWDFINFLKLYSNILPSFYKAVSK